MLKTVRVSEASWRVMKEHSKDLKVWREELRTIAGSRTRKAEPPPEISGDLEEGVIRGKLCRMTLMHRKNSLAAECSRKKFSLKQLFEAKACEVAQRVFADKLFQTTGAECLKAREALAVDDSGLPEDVDRWIS